MTNENERVNNNTTTIYNPQSTIFCDTNAAIDFCLNKGMFQETINCASCGSIMKIENYSKALNGKVYRCVLSRCKKRKPIAFESFLCGTRLELSKILLGIFCFLMNYHNYQALNILLINEKTFIKLKKEVLNKIKNYINSIDFKLGGYNIAVQCDETAICDGMIISDPTHTVDNNPRTQWIIGIVEETEEQKFIFKIVPNRQALTIANIFNTHLHPGTIVKTDGYPSYIPATRNSGFVHQIVNHNQGFVNENGVHTNLIENHWSHFKTMYRSRHGLQRENLENFIYEFIWKKSYFKDKSNNGVKKAFDMLIDIIKR